MPKRNYSQVVKLAYDIFKTFRGLISREDAFLFAFASYQWAIEAKKEEEKRKKYLYNFK